MAPPPALHLGSSAKMHFITDPEHGQGNKNLQSCRADPLLLLLNIY